MNHCVFYGHKLVSVVEDPHPSAVEEQWCTMTVLVIRRRMEHRDINQV